MEIPISGTATHRYVRRRHFLQLLRVMRLTVLLFFIACLHVSGHGYSQTVTFSGKNVSLEAVFASIEKQTGLSFFFNYSMIKDSRPVTLEVRDMPLEEVLKDILFGQGLEYYMKGKTIFIVKKTSAPTVENSLTVSPPEISGVVKNEDGIPLAGATIEIRKLNLKVIANEKGEFLLKGIPNGKYLVQITFIG